MASQSYLNEDLANLNDEVPADETAYPEPTRFSVPIAAQSQNDFSIVKEESS